MLTKNECDLIWKIRHGAIPTGRFLYGCKYLDSPNCNYSGELDDLTHVKVYCILYKVYCMEHTVYFQGCSTNSKFN